AATFTRIWKSLSNPFLLAIVSLEVRLRGCRPALRRTLMLLITGAAGNSGRLIVKALSQQAQRLRVLVRRPESVELFSGMQGVEVQVADLARPETLEPALDGVRYGTFDLIGRRANARDAVRLRRRGACEWRAQDREILRPGVRRRLRSQGVPLHPNACRTGPS